MVITCLCDAVGCGHLSVGFLGMHKGALWVFPDEERANAQAGHEIDSGMLERIEGCAPDRFLYLLQPSDDGFQLPAGKPRRRT